MGAVCALGRALPAGMKHALIAEQNAVFDALCHCYRAPTIELVANLEATSRMRSPVSM